MNLFAKRKTENQYPSIEILPYSELFEKADQQFLSQREIKRERERASGAACLQLSAHRRGIGTSGNAIFLFSSEIYTYIYPDSFDRLRQTSKKESISRLKIAGPSAYLGRPNKLA